MRTLVHIVSTTDNFVLHELRQHFLHVNPVLDLGNALVVHPLSYLWWRTEISLAYVKNTQRLLYLHHLNIKSSLPAIACSSSDNSSSSWRCSSLLWLRISITLSLIFFTLRARESTTDVSPSLKHFCRLHSVHIGQLERDEPDDVTNFLLRAYIKNYNTICNTMPQCLGYCHHNWEQRRDQNRHTIFYALTTMCL